MKKIVLFLMLLIPLTLSAKWKYVVSYNTPSGPSYYEKDSIKVDVYMGSNDYLMVTIYNSTDQRVTVEWEGVKITGSHIAFLSDYIYQLNNPRPAEIITAHNVTFKSICKRYSTRVPIVDKKKLKKGEDDYFYLDIPMKVGEKINDISLKFYVKMIKE